MPTTAATSEKIDLSSWQEHLDFLLPRKELLRVDEVANAIACDVRTVLRLFDDAQLFGHDINAATQERKQLRYRRSSVLLFLAKRANYQPADLRQRLLEVIATLSLRELVLLHQSLGETIRKRQS